VSVTKKKITTALQTINLETDLYKGEKLFHRSRKRIRELGEVFTPEAYVTDMLKLISQNNKGLWSSENVCFFEPCCGHGNIVSLLYKKRLDGLYKKAQRKGIQSPALFAIANAVNTLWAIDIDAQNIVQCKTRLLAISLAFIKEKMNFSDVQSVIVFDPEFFAHLLCAINWHIVENDTLSCLSEEKSAQANACKTLTGQQWFMKNGYQPINFEKSWINHFTKQQVSNLRPFVYKQAARFIKNLLDGKTNHDKVFEFADFINYEHKSAVKRPSQNKKLATG